MAKQRYHFNRDQLSFTEAKRTWKSVLLSTLRYLLATFAIAVIAFMLFASFFQTPREQQIRQENALLAKYIDSLRTNYIQVEEVLGELEQRDDNIYRMLFECEPEESKQEQTAKRVNGILNLIETEGVKHVSRLNREALASLSPKIRQEKAIFDDLIALAQGSSERMLSIPAIHPIADPAYQTVSAPFGMRIHPFYKVLKMHNGIDYAAPVGTPVRCTAQGQVVEVLRSQRGRGNSVRIDHGHGYQTLYAHLQDFKVKKGQQLSRADIICTTGSSGMSMAPHLHYEVRYRGNPVDPLHFLFLDLDPANLATTAQRAAQVGQTLD